MHILLLYLVGIVAGGVTTIACRTKSRQRGFLNVAAGIFGALFGGLFLARAFGASTALNSFIGAALLAAGAAGLLLLWLTLLRNWYERRR
ncbi:MAG: hypothetical protein WC804_00425 [Sphingomonas sp.]|uniref:hypothetical protein n=1 Tax=Sphingomonas sp. TaxID=28214 RepID=UPI0035682705